MALSAFAAVLLAYAAQRQVSGLEGVLDGTDPTNGGFWDVSGRAATAVDDGTVAISAAIDLSGGMRFPADMDGVDTRALSLEESATIPLRTDVPRGLWIILR